MDGTNDYLFGTRSSAPNFAFMFPAASSSASYNSNAMVGFSTSGFNYPSNLASGTPIDNTNGIFSLDRGDFNYNGCAFPGSQFCDGMDGLVGLHFKIGTDTHYGWVRIQVAADASNIIIKDFAYNSTPGAAINAGQSTLTIEESLVNNIRIIALNKSIALYNLPENLTYELFSVSGQSILKGQSNSDTHVIEAKTAATGVYILELNDINGGATIRKKIVL